MGLSPIRAHDSGRWIGPHGLPAPTPPPSEPVRQGVAFRSRFGVATARSTSRSAMPAGVRAHATGRMGLAHRGFRPCHP